MKNIKQILQKCTNIIAFLKLKLQTLKLKIARAIMWLKVVACFCTCFMYGVFAALVWMLILSVATVTIEWCLLFLLPHKKVTQHTPTTSEQSFSSEEGSK